MTPLDLAAIEKAAKEATQGEWGSVATAEGAFTVLDTDGAVLCSRAPWPHRAVESCANARFIALANPATILALCARLREPAKVKPLVWREYPNAFQPDVFFRCWDAETPFGRYTIEEASASDSAYYTLSFGHIFIADKDGLPDAKAAAQQHFGDSIKGVLE